MAGKTVVITTPDGVERTLNYTFGARRRIAEEFGGNLIGAFIKLDEAALPGLLFCLMYDTEGNPPKGLTLASYQEGASSGDIVGMAKSLLAAIELKSAGPRDEILVTALRGAVELMERQPDVAPVDFERVCKIALELVQVEPGT